MAWDEIRKAVNSDLNVPLNHLIWLNDYKTYGENSYVFQNKDILHELLSNYILSMNDPIILTDALNFAMSNNEFSKAVQYYKKIGDPSVFNGIETFDDIVSERDALSTIFNDIVLASSLLHSSDFISALYANPANADAVLTSDVIAYMSALKETITSTITVEEPIFIIDVKCNATKNTGTVDDSTYVIRCVAGGNYTTINGETVTVSDVITFGDYANGPNYTTINSTVNSFGTKINLTTANRSYSSVSSTAKSTANIVRLPLVRK